MHHGGTLKEPKGSASILDYYYFCLFVLVRNSHKYEKDSLSDDESSVFITE